MVGLIGRSRGREPGPLRRHDVRLLVAGQLASSLGDWIDLLAVLALVAYVWEGDAGALAAVGIAAALPWLVVAPVAGVLADRLPPRVALVGSDLARAGIVAGLLVAPNLPVLLVLVLAKHTVGTLFLPAQQAVVRRVAADHELHAVTALMQGVNQFAKVVGPAIGGVLVTAFDARAAFAVDAVTFLVSAAVLSRLDVGPAPAPAAPGTADADVRRRFGSFWRESAEGLRFVRARPALTLSIVSMSATVFLVVAFDTLSPLAFAELGGGTSFFGVAVGCVGLGGLLGTVAVGVAGARVDPLVLMGGAKVVVGALVVVLGVAVATTPAYPTWVWLPALVMIGVASAGVLVGAPVLVLRETPPELVGRVTATAQAIPTVFQVIAPVVGAALAARFGVGSVYVLAGGLLAVLGVVVLVIRRAGGGRFDGPS